MARKTINYAHGDDTRNNLNYNFKELYDEAAKYSTIRKEADSVVKEAKRTNDMNKDVQQQLDAIILENGDSEAEVVQARGGLPLLKDRLDKVDARLADLSINIMEFEHLKVIRGNGYDWQPVFQAAVNYAHAQGGGKLYAPKKVYELYNSIEWETNISLFGAGIGKTILRPIGNTLSAIKQVNEEKYNKDNPLLDVAFVDFEVDGTGFTNTTHSMAVKGLFILYMRRASFLNLYIHDTIGTGLGCDFLDQTVIHNVIAENCGRLYGTAPTGQNIGGAGIGVGIGVWESETLTISDCHTINCGSNGIFVEKQGNSAYEAKGIRIVNCTANGNRENGIEDKGAKNLIVTGCTMENNAKYGYKLAGNVEATAGRLTNNIIANNGIDGVLIGQLSDADYHIKDNTIYENAGRGILIKTASSHVKGLNIKGNEIHDNGLHGIDFVASSNGMLEHLITKDNIIYNNGASDRYFGINIAVNLKNFDISDNYFYDDRTTVSQVRGINGVSSRSYEDGKILHNSFRDAPLGIELLGPRTNVEILDNYGHKTEVYGSAQFLDSEETITVPHGLLEIPNYVNVGINSVTNTEVWVRDVGTVNVVFKRADVTGELDVFFHARH